MKVNSESKKMMKKPIFFCTFFKKGIDKQIVAWYNNQALAKRRKNVAE